MNDSVKNILWWMGAIAVIALCVWGIHSCNRRNEVKQAEKQAIKEKEEIQKQVSLINDPYLYVDRNGVYHIDKNCFVLSMGKFHADNNSNATYSVSYQPKDEINDWDAFAATHQLCTDCFDSDIIKALTHSTKHGSIEKKYPDSIHIYDEKSKIVEKIYRKYDTKGHIIEEEKWELNDGKWMGKFKDEYAYDEQGHEIMHAPYCEMENGKWVGSEWFCKVEKTYSVYGNVKVEKFYTWRNKEWSLYKKIERSYDEFDQITTETHYKYVNNKWVLEEQKRRVNIYNTTEGVNRMKDI